MCRCSLSLVLWVAAWPLCAQQTPPQNPVLGVVSSARDFFVGSVEERPETGPIAVVDGDEVSSAATPVTFRLEGDNRAVLGINSVARIRPTGNSGDYFYLRKGSIQYDARKNPIAVCAQDRLYVPSVPGSGEVLIGEKDKKVQVRLTSGTMVRSGTEPCDAKSAPIGLMTEIQGAGAGGAPATATATATAVSAGGGAGLSTAATIGIATATAGGIVGGVLAAQAPAPQSQTTPGP